MSNLDERDAMPSREEIAIIGMAGRFPGARNIDEFWHNLKNSVESVKPISLQELQAAGVDEKTLKDPYFVNAAAIMPDADAFDASFFGVGVREAEIMDPQHRVFLETAWEALENAGYDPEKFRGLIGVFGGVAANTYFQNNLATKPELLRTLGRYAVMLGSEREYAITRVSFKLNLTGPSISVNTACSTSGVAIHLACQSLLGGECDLALAGGARILVPFNTGYLYEEGGIQSPDGHCRAFDVDARGTVVGNGVGILVLKRLSEAIQDGDCIQAVIKGSAINNDGSQKVGFTAPSVQGQASVIRDALTNADVNPDSIGYVEAHGTGTSLGDPIEIAALTKAFRNWTTRRGYCPIGSVKTNIGHLDAGAGVAGVIKTVLALKRRQIPPSLNFSRPNPQINFEASPFYINTALTDWQAGAALRAGVSSFGLGGTNAHIILEQAPEIKPSGSSRSQQLLLLSAKSDTALTQATKNLAQHLRQHPDSIIADVAYTLQTGRQVFNHRRFFVCQDIPDAIAILETENPKRIAISVQEPVDRNIVFMFSGQGSQYVNMGLGLYRNEPSFKRQVDQCSEILKPYLSLDLRQIIYPDEQDSARAAERLQQTAFTQPALFVIEYALALLWSDWGIRPSAMIGHSIGEYVAACLAGVFSLEDALLLVSARGKHMQQMPNGSMLAVPLSEKSVQPYLNEATSIAAVNGPSLCVVSGEYDAIKDLEKQLVANGIESTYLHTSHAFHSRMMEPVLEPYTNEIRKVKLNAPQIPFVSNVTGTWITADQATEPSYWAKHLRQPVRFADGTQELVKESHPVLIEIGPGRTLCTLARQNLGASQTQVTLASIRQPKENEDDLAFILNSLGRLWADGVPVNWVGFYANEHRHRVPLPTYPFERRRYWISPAKHGYAPALEESALGLEPEETSAIGKMHTPESGQMRTGAPRNDVERSLAKIWQGLLGTEELSIHDNFFDLGGSSLLATRLLTQIANVFDKRLSLATLFEAPTIAKLADMLGQPVAPVTHSSLVKIQEGDRQTRPPIYCLLGNLGNVYTDLGHLYQHLGLDQPFYGLQDGIGHPWKIEALAAHYVEEIRAVQAEGPYYIVGICAGGVVAFEMAQQLTHLGHQVDLLALVEPAALPLPGIRSYFDLLGEIWMRFTHRGRYSTQVAKLSWKEIVVLIRLRMKLIANLWGLKLFAPQPYPGSLHIFLTKESLTQSSRIGWREFALDGVQVYEIPGTHRSITGDYEPVADAHMRVLGEQLRVCMDNVLSDNKGKALERVAT